MDYIELQNIVRAIRRLPSQWKDGEVFLNKEDVVDALYLALRSTIVYCGECKYCYTDIDEDGYKFLKCIKSGNHVRAENFCSWGERKC